MRIELNHKEYISELYPPDLIKCNYCALTFLQHRIVENSVVKAGFFEQLE